MSKEILPSRKTAALVYAILILIACAFLAVCIIGILHIDRVRYRECYNNPPTLFKVEEELKTEFLTLDPEIIDNEREDKIIIYTVKANGIYYKVLYGIKNAWIGSYYWHLVRYVQIAESEVNND